MQVGTSLMRELEGSLRRGVSALGLTLSDLQVTQLLDYLALIQKWNKVYNLTAVRDPAQMLTHHLLDSLAVVSPLILQIERLIAEHGDGGNSSSEGAMPSLRGQCESDAPLAAQLPDEVNVAVATESVGLRLSPPKLNALPTIRLLDVGSGAGLPGVVIAISCPELRVDCVDTVGKKAAFIQQVAVSLKLPRLRGIHARVESLTESYELVSSRAFASLVDFVSLSEPALKPGGIWMALKGKHPTDEIAELPPSVRVFHVEQLQVPDLDADRCIVWMRREDAVSAVVEATR